MPHALFSQIGTLLLVAVGVAALAWGGARERRGGVIVLAAGAAKLMVQRLSGRYDPATLFATVDALVLVALLGLTWRSPVVWPFLAVGFQGVAMALHAIRELSPAMSAWTYVTTLAITSDGVLACLAWGTWSAWRARKSGDGLHS